MSDFRTPTTYTRSHRVRLEVASLDTSGNFSRSVTPLAGSVDVDATAAVRRRMKASFAVTDSSLLPSGAGSPFAPGRELKPYRGATTTASDYVVSLGVFRIISAEVNDEGAGWRIDIDGLDRSDRVSRARYLTPYTIAGGTNYGVAIRTLISAKYAAAVFAIDFSTVTTLTTPDITLGLTTDADPWKDARSLAAAIGFELYVDNEGRFNLTPGSQRRWLYAEGADSPLISVTRSHSIEKAYSHVIVTGQSDTGAPVRGEATDTIIGSPTNINTFGDVPYFLHSPLVKTDAQAAAAASTILTRVRGAAEELGVSSMVNPELEAGETVVVTRRGVTSSFIVDGFSVPFGVNERQTLKVRRSA